MLDAKVLLLYEFLVSYCKLSRRDTLGNLKPSLRFGVLRCDRRLSGARLRLLIEVLLCLPCDLAHLVMFLQQVLLVRFVQVIVVTQVPLKLRHTLPKGSGCLLLLIEGLEPLSVRENVGDEFVGEGQMIHFVDVVVVHRELERPRGEANGRTHASHQALPVQVLIGIVVLDVWFPHELFQFLHLLSERSLVTLAAHDLAELKLLLKGGPEVNSAVALLVHP